MNRFLSKGCIIIMLFMYSIVSQFIFKAIATTPIDPIDLEIDTICYGKKIDTFDSKQSCWKTSFTTQAWCEWITLELQCIKYVSVSIWDFIFNKPSSTNETFQRISRVRPPPDILISWIHVYWYIGVWKSII